MSDAACGSSHRWASLASLASRTMRIVTVVIRGVTLRNAIEELMMG